MEKEEGLDVTVGSTVSVTSMSEVGKKEEKLDETVGSTVSLMRNSEVCKNNS